MVFVNILVVVLMLASTILLSSCSVARGSDEGQTQVIDPDKVTTGESADNQGEDKADTDDLHGKDGSASADADASNLVADTDEGDKATNEDANDDAGNDVKEFDIVADLQLGELKVDMPKAEVEKVMKSELVDSTTKEEYGMKTEILTYKDGTVIHLLDGKVYSVTVKSSDYATPRGLKVGDTEETIRKLYGEPSAVEDGKWIYSPRGYDLFFVTVKDGVVVEIMISQVL